MRQHSIGNGTSGDHYAIGSNTQIKGQEKVLIQIQENGEQVRIALNLQQATHFMEVLAKHISNITPESK